MNPVVSIVTPLFNKEKYIEQTIYSVLSQTFEHWEMLVIDNMSTDQGFEVAQQIKDERLKFYQCFKRGPGATRNLGIQNATGQWILFLDADDLLEPDYLKNQLQVAKAQSNLDVIVSCWQEFTDAEEYTRNMLKPSGITEPLQDSAIAYTPWAPHAAIVKRSILNGEYLWPEELDQYLAEDTAFWFRLSSRYTVGYNPRSEALYRVGSIGARTDFTPSKWFEGNHEAIVNNLRFLERHSIQVTTNQMIFLFKFYFGTYVQACHQNSINIQNLCIKEANLWLNLYLQKSSKPKIGMLLCRLLGIRVFMYIYNFWLAQKSFLA